MANHKSAEKRARQNERRRVRNSAVKSALRTLTKKFIAAVESNDQETAEQLLSPTCRAWDKAVSKNVVHKNAAARKKSRLAKKVNDLKIGKVTVRDTKRSAKAVKKAKARKRAARAKATKK